METLTISLDVPRDLIGALNVPENQLGARIKELVALELFREGHISSGKAAELLGWSKILARPDIPYFRQSPEDLTDELATIEGPRGNSHA